VIPSQAVQIGQDNSFVYAVKPDMTVEVRNVKTGPAYNEMVVIEDGIKPGEKVVTDGQLRLVPGAMVQAKDQQKNAQQTNNGSSAPASESSGARKR
jgi:multidrug efflux system membrane fusion protein